MNSKSLQILASVACLTLVGVPITSAPVRAVILATSTGATESVNPLTGAVTPYNNNTSVVFGDIALSDANVLYGISFGQTTTNLYTISSTLSTAPTLIGSTGTTSTQNLNGLGFDDSGNLFATGTSNFYSLNKLTGLATQVGSSITNFTSSGDLAFDLNKNLFYAVSQPATGNSVLYSIATNGTAKQIGSNLGFTNVYGLAFDKGLLYGYSATGQELTINEATGAAAFQLNVTGTQAANTSSTINIYGSANNNSESVPEPFSIIGTLFGGIAAFYMKKKLKATAN